MNASNGLKWSETKSVNIHFRLDSMTLCGRNCGQTQRLSDSEPIRIETSAVAFTSHTRLVVYQLCGHSRVDRGTTTLLHIHIERAQTPLECVTCVISPLSCIARLWALCRVEFSTLLLAVVGQFRNVLLYKFQAQCGDIARCVLASNRCIYKCMFSRGIPDIRRCISSVSKVTSSRFPTDWVSLEAKNIHRMIYSIYSNIN